MLIKVSLLRVRYGHLSPNSLKISYRKNKKNDVDDSLKSSSSILLSISF
jgi:hypothetical protein